MKELKPSLFFLIVLCLSSCQRDSHSPDSVDPEAEIPVFHLANDTEPGERLIIEVKVSSKLDHSVVSGTELFFYQTNNEGVYQPQDGQDETSARLNLCVTTGELGKFILHTILPGEYPDSPLGNRHIHYSIEGGSAGVILFDHNVNESVREWALETGFGRIIKVDKIDGIWRGELNFEI